MTPADPFALRLLVVEVADRCDLDCLYCRRNLKPPAGDLPTAAELKAFLRAVPRWHAEAEVNFSGGEPLLRADIADLVAAAAGEGKKVSLATNGLGLTSDRIRALDEAGLTSVSVSIDSLEASVHDRLRNAPGALARAREGLERLLRERRKIRHVVVQCVITAWNADSLPALLDWAEDEPGITGVFFLALTRPHFDPLPDPWQTHCAFWPGPRDALCRELLARKAGGGKVINHPSQLHAFQRYFRNPADRARPGCPIPDGFLIADPDKTLSLCSRFRLPAPMGPEAGAFLSSPGFEALRARARQCPENCEFLINCFFRDEGCGEARS